jgi:hypothetical protein
MPAKRFKGSNSLQAFAILVNDSHASQPLGRNPLSWTDCEGLPVRLCFDVVLSQAKGKTTRHRREFSLRSAGFMVVGVNHTLKLRELTWTHVSHDESILIMCPVQANRSTTMIGRTRVSILAIPRTCRPSQSIYQSAGSPLLDVVNQSSESFSSA